MNEIKNFVDSYLEFKPSVKVYKPLLYKAYLNYCQLNKSESLNIEDFIKGLKEFMLSFQEDDYYVYNVTLSNLDLLNYR